MTGRTVEPTALHHAFRDELVELLRKHTSELDAKEVLAIAAHTVGQIIAMQDQRTMTIEIAMEIVARNIEIGNGDALVTIRGKVAGSA